MTAQTILRIIMEISFYTIRFFFLPAVVLTTCAVTTQSQPVHVSSNRHYLAYRGNPILPIGDSVTQGWMESGTDFNQRAYIDALAARGINVVLLWSYIATSGQAQRLDKRVGYDAPELWPWKGSPDDCSFDLARFNPAYFQRLREFVEYAENRNIIVILTVQDGWTKTRFAYHPFNSALGNGPLTDRKQFVELADYDQEMTAIFDITWNRQQKNQWFQERYADKLCSELKDCRNLIFEMFNEGEWYNREQRRRHEEHFLSFFRKRTTALLMTNTDHIRIPNFAPRENPDVDILSLHKQPWTGHYETFVREFRAKPVRVIFESEPVPSFGNPERTSDNDISLSVLRAAVWERIMSGSGWVAQNDTSFGWNPKSGMAGYAKLRDRAYDLIGHAARFFNQSGVRFWNMMPYSELASTGICLAQPGVEYVIYSPEGGSFTVDISAGKGRAFSVQWYNPRNGEFQVEEKLIDGSCVRNFTPPFKGDAVLHLIDQTPKIKSE